MIALRRALYRQLEPKAWSGRGLSPINYLLVVAILLATTVAIVGTEPLVTSGNEAFLNRVDLCFGAFFLLEYVARAWSVGEDPRYRGLKRFTYLITPSALIDLSVVLVSLAPLVVGTLFPLRLLRLFSILRFAKLGRLSSAMRHLADAVIERRLELLLTVLLALSLIIIGATGMWLAESGVQPDKFGSIPRSMWWAAVTLTTIGYGDVFPITIAGKVIAVLVAIAGIGLIAMPAGILAAAFSDAIARSRK